LLARGQIARGVMALGAGRFGDAYIHLRRIVDRADPAYHQRERLWVLDYLVEAAVYGGRREDARALIAEVAPLAIQVPSSRFRIGLQYARALVADDEDADVLFQTALSADLTGWPFARARLQLAYGAWLRRRRRVAESRPHLRAARDTCDALGALAWGERARQELRAAGETSRRRTPDALELLTPQELQIAQMAAGGLSNREIGQRLYLSHRTIGMHLYHIFPKLGISNRSELRTALDAGNLVGTWSPT
jgi:DNA-binding CsgD family transcriptional regulator